MTMLLVKKDLQFYKKILIVAMPIIIQNIITNFVSLVDNIMIGRLGTFSMSGVSITNAILFVFNLTIYGCISGPSIYTSQFVGNKNKKGVQECIYFKLIIGLITFVLAALLFLNKGETLIGFYLSNKNNPTDNLIVLNEAFTYLKIMVVGLLPFMFSQVYASTLRETGNTFMPMVASTTAIITNVILNAVLIFGLGPFPCLKVAGGAIATVISRYIEFFILIIYAHFKDMSGYFKKLFTSFHINLSLYKNIIIKGFPLLCNECLWGFAIKAIIQCYSTRGISAVAAMNITTTVSDAFNIMTYSMGIATSIILAQKLGSDDHTGVYEDAIYMIVFNIFMCALMGTLLLISAPLFANLYNTSSTIKHIAVICLRITAIDMCIQSIDYTCYYILRSGGKTFITFLFDSIYTFCVTYLIAFILSRFSSLDLVMMYLIVCLMNLPKAVLGITLIKKKIWINNIVESY